ncbi:very-long-chain 3-oxoacyl-CoA reductase-like [Spea bombifrons]|uniref:very-long-chain 3-oxoacyl-CoA reductase-like n=1 Tax=Spea bombifrons TaxID=233779 RepID=UPI00234AB027|nr:very-long-chain 3-oxoacyl-CoA reductase-like [Spea bombifrons]
MSELGSLASAQGFTFIGVLVALYWVLTQGWKLVRGIRNHVLSEWWQTDLKQFGGWAVITGATDGIGKAYARELAKRGLDIVLVSRTLEKLRNVAEDIEQEFGCKTKVIQADFTRGSELYQKIQDDLKGMEIGILVNNVGMMICDSPTSYLDTPNIVKALVDTINCNMLSVLQMTRIALPQMVERKKGLIINLSSEIGNHPYPMTLVYSASKAFVDFFSQGLHAEYKAKGIIVQCVMPLLVSTSLTYKMKTNIFVKSPDDFARESLNTVGYTSRTSGCLSHSLQSYALDLLLPEPAFNFLLSMKAVESHFENVRNEYKSKKDK